MNWVGRRHGAGQSVPVADPALDTWRLPAALIGEIPRLRRYATAWLGHAAAADGLVRDAIECVIAEGDPLDEPHRLRVRLLGLLHDLHEADTESLHTEGPTGPRGLTLALHSHVAHAERAWMQELVGAIEQLSDEHRQALLLVALEGLSYRDVADILEVSLGTVVSHLALAREELLAQTGGPRARDRQSPSRSNREGATARPAVSELDLHAYLDGELGADRVQAVEAFLQSRPNQAARLEALAEQDEMIRKLYGPLLNRPVPLELLAPLLTVIPDPVGRRAELAAIGAAVGLLLGIVAGWMLCSYSALAIPWLAR